MLKKRKIVLIGRKKKGQFYIGKGKIKGMDGCVKEIKGKIIQMKGKELEIVMKEWNEGKNY